MLLVGVELAEDLGDGGFVLGRLVEVVDVFDDITGKGDVVADRLRLQEVFDHVPLEDVVRIVHDDVDDAVLLLQRDPEFPAEVLLLEVDEQVARDRVSDPKRG